MNILTCTYVTEIDEKTSKKENEDKHVASESIQTSKINNLF